MIDIETVKCVFWRSFSRDKNYYVNDDECVTDAVKFFGYTLMWEKQVLHSYLLISDAFNFECFLENKYAIPGFVSVEEGGERGPGGRYGSLTWESGEDE